LDFVLNLHFVAVITRVVAVIEGFAVIVFIVVGGFTIALSLINFWDGFLVGALGYLNL